MLYAMYFKGPGVLYSFFVGSLSDDYGRYSLKLKRIFIFKWIIGYYWETLKISRKLHGNPEFSQADNSDAD